MASRIVHAQREGEVVARANEFH